jgi:hypothetical protein
MTLGVVFILCLVIFWRVRQEMGHMKQELHEVTDANEVLKTNLGELTIAITQREAEIDRLRSSTCEIPQAERQDSKPMPFRIHSRTKLPDLALMAGH